MAYKMKGFGGFGNSPAKQTKFPNSPKAIERKNKKEFPGIDMPGDKDKSDKPWTPPKFQGGVRWDKDAEKKLTEMFPPADKKKSPGKQTKFPNSPKSQIKLQKGEMEGTSVTGGSESERIADLRDRIEFLTSDIEGGSDRPGQSMSDMKKARAKLQARLVNIRKADKK